MTIRSCLKVIFCLLPPLVGSVTLGGEDGQVDRPNIRHQVRQTRRELWRAGIDVPKGKTKDQNLQQAIQQLLSAEKHPWIARGKPPRSKPPAGRQAGNSPASQPTSAPASRPAGQLTARKSPPAQTKESGISSITLGQLRKLSAKGVSRPIALADSLFRGDYLEEAAAMYQMAMQQDPTPVDRAWALFQLGNCKRKDDPEMAMGFYRRLLTEYPDSQWGGVAEIQDQLIEWRRINNPAKLIKELKADADMRGNSNKAHPAERSPGSEKP